MKYHWLIVKLILFCDCNWTWIQNHLVRKRPLNHWTKLAKWLSGHLRTKSFWVRFQLLSLKFQILRLPWAKSSLTWGNYRLCIHFETRTWHDKNLILTWSADCVIIYTNVANQIPTFAITEANLYVPVVTLSTQDNAKLLTQLKPGFTRTISWNKYLSKSELLPQNPNLNHSVEPSFQDVNRLLL